MKYIKWFKDISISDIESVGGKNASLGQMISNLSDKGVRIPNGFAIVVDAYWHVLRTNKILDPLKKNMARLTDHTDLKLLKEIGDKARSLIDSAKIPDDLVEEIIASYQELCLFYKSKNVDVAVRSSATAEDLPTASFAGQQETFLNVSGTQNLINAVKNGMVSLFTDRAIVYRIEKGFDHFKVGISIGVQKMVRSDLASSGVAFTLDTETGFKDVIFINASYGLGENIVKGVITPDEFYVHKPTLEQGFKPVLKKRLGNKDKKLVYSDDPKSPVKNVAVATDKQQQFALTDDEILDLSRMCITIEKHYSDLKNEWVPQDIEWAKDGIDGKIYIVQSRPETVHAHDSSNRAKEFVQYKLKEHDTKKLDSKIIVTGSSIGQKIVSGTARVIASPKEIEQIEKGDILVTDMTDPDWVPIMKRAAGIVTNKGGRTCHAAIVSRELGIPAIVGALGATEKIKTGDKITIDASRGKTGYIYKGALEFEKIVTKIEKLQKLPVQIMVNLGDPDQAFAHSFLPVDGVGLARIEFIIANTIKVHPMAVVQKEKVVDKKIKEEIEKITAAYESGKHFFVDVLSQEVGTIVAAFYPRPVIVRLSDFKTNEYRNLLGGQYFEPVEANPMLGLRGASRYTNDLYAEAFALECAALKKVREVMGLKNMKIMIPFVRTVNEAKQVIEQMEKFGLKRGANGLELVMMVEVPSNSILIDDFCAYFDGFSIGSNDLTQMTLAVDRDSQLLAKLFDERNEAVKKMMQLAIVGARRHKKFIGICGQAPSDYPEIAKFLIDVGITSLSLNPDAVVRFAIKPI